MKTIESTRAAEVTIITGAAHGIGRAVAETLVAHGASVALVDLRIEVTPFFLVSEAASFIMGATPNVNGGPMMV